MDETRFDTLARSLGMSGSRRRALGGLLIGTLGVFGWHDGDEVVAHDLKAKCQKKSGKAKRKCRKKARKHVATHCGTGGPCLVFVTSTTHQGNLGGLAAADEICQQRAQAADLPGTYKAWLSDTSDSPDTRFVKSPAPYRLPNGTTVADSYADLTDSSLDAIIDRTEFGQAASEPLECWTNTDSDGSAFSGTDHCSNWTSTSGDGHYGRAAITTHNWTNWNSTLCSEFHRLYCFQQS